MKKITSTLKRAAIILLGLAFALNAYAEKRYDLKRPCQIKRDSMSSEVKSVFTMNDTLIVLACSMRMVADDKIVFPYVDAFSTLKVERVVDGVRYLSDTCQLLNIFPLDPETGNIVEKELLGFYFWDNVVANRDYEYFIVFRGKLNPGDEYLSIMSDLKTTFNFKDIHIANANKVLRMAYPTTTVNVRGGASKESSIIGRAESTEVLVAEYDKKKSSEYCKVVVLSTGLEGYVHCNNLNWGEVLPDVAMGVLNEFLVTGISIDPEVEIINSTSITVTVSLNGTEYILSPGEKRTVTTRPGVCYEIISDGLHQQYYGTAILKKGNIYESTIMTTQK